MINYYGNTNQRVTRNFADEMAEVDDDLEQELGDEAIIDRRWRVPGYLLQPEPVRINLGNARAGMKIHKTIFKMRLCKCPGVACGMQLEACGEMYKIGDISPPSDGYVHLSLTHCGAC